MDAEAEQITALAYSPRVNVKILAGAVNKAAIQGRKQKEYADGEQEGSNITA